jgi:hypothetical protein
MAQAFCRWWLCGLPVLSGRDFLYGIHATSLLADVMAALFVQTTGQRMQGLCGQAHHTIWQQ